MLDVLSEMPAVIRMDDDRSSGTQVESVELSKHCTRSVVGPRNGRVVRCAVRFDISGSVADVVGIITPEIRKLCVYVCMRWDQSNKV